MTGKERILAALHHKEGDRVPTGENQVNGPLASRIIGRHTCCCTGWEETNYLWEGRRDEVASDYKKTFIDLVNILEWDYVRVPLVPARKEYVRPKITGPYSFIDEEGHAFSFNPDAGDVIIPHLSADLTTDDLPDPDKDAYKVDESELEAVRHISEKLGGTHFIIGRTPIDGTFPWTYTVGMEEFLVRMLSDDEFVEKAVDVYVSRSVKAIEAMIDAGADAVMTTDDYCDNCGPIMGIELFRKYIVPGIKRQVEATHRKGAYFIKHTDGNTWPILNDLVDVGIDGWHGIQINMGLDLAKLKRKYGGKICFFGGTNCDSLMEGKPEEVEREVMEAISAAAPGGGLVLTTSNVLPPGVIYDNYKAQREATKKYGKYPITVDVLK